jgi:methylated-DNA-protein-cysteine methyltransferase-like protein
MLLVDLCGDETFHCGMNGNTCNGVLPFPHQTVGGEMARHTAPRETTANFYERVYAFVRHIPYGRVVTYGQVAAHLGAPRAARAVGYALRALPDGAEVPWHRVINHRGQISARHPAAGPILQRLLLENEGVYFDVQDSIDLSVYRWLPEMAGA